MSYEVALGILKILAICPKVRNIILFGKLSRQNWVWDPFQIFCKATAISFPDHLNPQDQRKCAFQSRN